MTPPQHLPNGQVASYQDNSAHGEDAFLTRELGPFMALDAVLDGATGHGGKFASSQVAEALQDAQISTVQDCVTLLESLNQTLFQRGRGNFLLTTLTAALKLDETLHVISVGDSPGYLIRGESVIPLTPAATHATVFGIAGAIGRHTRLSSTTKSFTLQPHDRLVLVTDGVLDNISPVELASLVQHAASAQEASARIRDLLQERKLANRGRPDEHSGFRVDDATAVIRFLTPGTGEA